MKVLMLADTEEKALWDYWNGDTAERLSDVGLILSAGDLDASYLEFLVTMLNVPLVYVRGNHDTSYENDPPEGCMDADGRIIEAECPETGGSKGYRQGRGALRTVRILGLGGSMSYKNEPGDMYTEAEMARRVRRAELSLAADRLKGKSGFDILLTHAPCKGYGDMDDIAHTGFECFNALLDRHSPALHCYGHVHREYGEFRRELAHPSGTRLINAGGYYLTDI